MSGNGWPVGSMWSRQFKSWCVLAVLLILPLVQVFSAVSAVGSVADSPRFETQASLEISAQGAIAVDLTSGVQLFAFNPDLPLRPASAVKIITALLARQILQLDETIEVESVDMVGDDISKVGLEPGDSVTVENLLYGLLVPSGGDAGMTLARVCGSRLDPTTADPVGRFVDEMNRFAARLGMSNSTFGNPIGLDDDNTFVSARDLLRATRTLLNDWLLTRIVGTTETTVSVGGPDAREISVENTNQLVLTDEAIGIKTGTNDLAGQALVNGYYYGDHQIITVVLGSADRYVDTQTILAAVSQDFRWIKLGGGGQSLGARDELAAMNLWMPVGRTLVLDADQVSRLSYTIELADTPIVGVEQGDVVFAVGSDVVARLPVYSIDTQPGG